MHKECIIYCKGSFESPSKHLYELMVGYLVRDFTTHTLNSRYGGFPCSPSSVCMPWHAKLSVSWPLIAQMCGSFQTFFKDLKFKKFLFWNKNWVLELFGYFSSPTFQTMPKRFKKILEMMVLNDLRNWGEEKKQPQTPLMRLLEAKNIKTPIICNEV